MEHVTVLSAIQAELNAPKGQTNQFGGYTYRSCEDILEALKPLLAKHGAAVTLTDEITALGDHVYIKARATLLTANEDIYCDAVAREAMDAKGMSPAQCTGAASSYARKYALNGLFCIDDNKDADATNTHSQEAPKPVEAKKPRFAKQEAVAIEVAREAIESWKDFLVPFGKNKGTALGKLPERSLSWYIENIDDKNKGFRNALDGAQSEMTTATATEKKEATTPNRIEELPFEDKEGDDELPF